jgi:hypothetical protein
VEIRHNTKLLEQAVALVVERAAIPAREAAARVAEKHAQAISKRRLATGIAIAVAAIGVGLGIMLGLWGPKREDRAIVALQPPVVPPPPTVYVTVTPSPRVTLEPKVTEKPIVPTGVPASSPPAPYHPPIANYTKFSAQTVNLVGADWVLEAGHQFANEADIYWQNAWCYTSKSVDGVMTKVDLAQRSSPFVQPVAPVASGETDVKVGLDDATALELASRCPWLDGKNFGPGDFAKPLGRSSVVLAPKEPLSRPDETTVPPNPPTPSIAPISYVPKDGFDALGNDLPDMPLHGINDVNCEQRCSKDVDCSAYTFNRQFNECYLKSTVTILFPNNIAYSGIKTGRASDIPISQIHVQTNVAIKGENYGQEQSMKYTDCVLACDNDRQCKGFNFETLTQQCTLFNFINGKIAASTITSGEKTGRASK